MQDELGTVGVRIIELGELIDSKLRSFGEHRLPEVSRQVSTTDGEDTEFDLGLLIKGPGGAHKRKV